MGSLDKLLDRLVDVHDPLGYSGRGVVVEVQERPHEAVRVDMLTITDRTDQTVVGRSVWVLADHVRVIQTSTDGAMGKCPVCHQWYHCLVDGRLRLHGSGGHSRCAGSGQEKAPYEPASAITRSRPWAL